MSENKVGEMLQSEEEEQMQEWWSFVKLRGGGIAVAVCAELSRRRVKWVGGWLVAVHWLPATRDAHIALWVVLWVSLPHTLVLAKSLRF